VRGTLKPGLLVPEDAPLELLEGLKFVSRGGEKLAGALDALKVDPKGLACLDVGASTGGFTDCLLQRGAAKVFCIDVGTHQLHEKLRNDPRVAFREQTHVLRLSPPDLPFPPELVVIDVSFISLDKILPHLATLARPGTAFVALVKPQFEVGPKLAPKGVVKDPDVRAAAVKDVAAALPGWGFRLLGECPSPLPGPEGNREHFLHFERVA
jgi:23S rRNA (cytidine1920-2'-O)/16S rRNA (cytidine1409-2'-O)-methyltransferase